MTGDSPTPGGQDDRFARHRVLPQFGADGQAKLASAKVLVVGVGGLGCAAATSLATMGIGTIGLADPDVIEESNLHRQPLYGPKDVGRPKVIVAQKRLQALSPAASILASRLAAGTKAGDELVQNYDIIIDGTDNARAHAALSAACRKASRPMVSATVYRYEGRITLLAPDGPCYRCLAPSASDGDSCQATGVLGSVPAVLGSLQATEAVRVLLGLGKSLEGRLLVLDLFDMRVDEFSLAGVPRCASCLRHDASSTMAADVEVEAATLAALDPTGARPTMIDVRTPEEVRRTGIPGSLSIPLANLEACMHEIPVGHPIVAYCETGIRSLEAALILRRHGRDGRSLRGGWRTLQVNESGEPIRP